MNGPLSVDSATSVRAAVDEFDRCISTGDHNPISRLRLTTLVRAAPGRAAAEADVVRVHHGPNGINPRVIEFVVRHARQEEP